MDLTKNAHRYILGNPITTFFGLFVLDIALSDEVLQSILKIDRNEKGPCK